MKTPIEYLSTGQVAKLINVKKGTLCKMKLPEPDAKIGRYKGWLKPTIDYWNANRPGRGNWKHGSKF